MSEFSLEDASVLCLLRRAWKVAESIVVGKADWNGETVQAVANTLGRPWNEIQKPDSRKIGEDGARRKIKLKTAVPKMWGARLWLHRREILRLRVPALRAETKARDTSLRMTGAAIRLGEIKEQSKD